MTYDVRLTIASGADTGVYSTDVIMQLSDDAHAALSTCSTCNVAPTDPQGDTPWFIAIAGNMLSAVASGAIGLPQITPEVFAFLGVAKLVTPGKIGISTTPTPAEPAS